MNRLRASLLQGSFLALAAASGLQCAADARAQVAGPPPGKALVVLYRADKQPVAARVPVIVNADRMGDIGNGEFVNAVVNPGRTFLRVGDRILTTLAVQTSANQTSYVLIEAVPGLVPVRVDMREMTEASARRALSQSRPAAGGAVAAVQPRAAAPAPAPAPAPRAPAAAVAPVAAAPAAVAPPPRPVQAAPPPQPAPPPPPARRPSTIAREPVASEIEEEEEEAERAKWRIAVIGKTGVYKLANTSPTLGGLQTSYDKNASPVLGFETEFRHVNGFAVGVELFYFKNNLSVPGQSINGEQTVLSTTINGKYYFGGPSGMFHPFLGAGIGFSAAKFGGDFQGGSTGPSVQAMLGLDLRFNNNIGLYLEYKYLNSTTSDNTNQQIKTGGSGILAGVSYAF
jgi:opacity protein-like surface antigen